VPVLSFLPAQPVFKVKQVSEFKIKLTLDIIGEHTQDADDELEHLCNYIAERLMIVGKHAVMQALAECIIELDEDSMLDDQTIH
jgi:hypothetical protein